MGKVLIKKFFLIGRILEVYLKVVEKKLFKSNYILYFWYLVNFLDILFNI